jgi:hypothetical protein
MSEREIPLSGENVPAPALPSADPELWPDPVDGRELLDELEATKQGIQRDEN